MKTAALCCAVMLSLSTLAAFAFDGEDAYGQGVHSDVYGQPFQYQTDDGQTVRGHVEPNGYGLGVGTDEYGRPVRAHSTFDGSPIDPIAIPYDDKK